jgi:hypothetical protein
MRNLPSGRVATRADLAEAIAKIAHTAIREAAPVTTDGSLPEAGTPLDHAIRYSFRNPMSAYGDMIAGGQSGGPVRLAIGPVNYILTVVDIGGGQLRPRWAAAPGGGGGGGGVWRYRRYVWEIDGALGWEFISEDDGTGQMVPVFELFDLE